MTTAGLLLAAGAGRRMGTPKALVGSWLVDSVGILRAGGCSSVTVVLGARAEEARSRVPSGVTLVVAGDWAEGMGISLRTGLAALESTADATGALVHLVDLPDVGADVVRRLLAADGDLRRATYDGRPGHPVYLGRPHWRPVIETATGDRGARDYLATHQTNEVECGDLATGHDVDTRG